MRNKKLLSTVVASAFVATTMAMPVMASESGSVPVDVTTKEGVLRVVVPTKMSMEIDQFEIGQAGAQIASSEFEMQNLSEMDVKVEVTSTAALDTGISLVSSKKAAADSTGDEAWLAAAAMTAAKAYDDASTTDATENYWDLTETNANVTTFASDTKKAVQTFYLAKASGDTNYQLAVPGAATQVDKNFAKFYKLTSISTQPTDDATLQTAVNASDVYVVVTNDVGNDGETVTKITKGTTVAGGSNAWDGDNTYYTADTTPSTPASGNVYVYASKATAAAQGAAAGFKYVGKLSNAKESWSTADITGVSIAYTITGVTATNYNTEKDNCTYGLYKEKPADEDPAIISVGEFDKANPANVVIKFSLGTGAKAVDADGVALAFGESKAVVNASKFTANISAGTATIDSSAGFLVNATADVPIYVSLTKNGTAVKELNGTITIK